MNKKRLEIKQELKEIKYDDYIKIPLHLILLANGYKYKKDKTTLNNPVLKHPINNDIIIISKMKDGNYLYQNAGDDKDKGTLWRFCKNRNIKAQELIKQYILYLQNPNIEITDIPKANTHEKNEVFEEYKNLENYDTSKHVYLTNRRKLNPVIVNSFEGIKVDSFNNVVIPQYRAIKLHIIDEEQKYNTYLCGYTKKLLRPFYRNNNKSEGLLKTLITGNKGIEILTPKNFKSNHITNIYITESIVDSLSLVELHNSYNCLNFQETMLIGTSGQFNINQENIKEVFNQIIKLNKNIYFKLGFDNDKRGDEYKQRFCEFFKEKNITKFRCYSPLIAKDFNDELKLIKLLKIKTDSYIELTKKSLEKIINKFYEQAPLLLYKNTATSVLKDIYKVDSLHPMNNLQKEILNKAIREFASKKTRER